MTAKLKCRILSIDGGGVRGIIPARLLQALEERTQKPVHQLFDLIVGTSTGGLIALALSCPTTENKPRYSAKNVVDFYLKQSPLIFPRSFFRKGKRFKAKWII
jgi:patatin-like phospholipase/acyl hydrolase